MAPRRSRRELFRAGSWLLCLVPARFQAPPQQQQQAQASGQSERVLQLTLEDALAIALRNNFDLEIEHLATEVARFDSVGSWGAFDPVVNVRGSASKSESEPSSRL